MGQGESEGLEANSLAGENSGSLESRAVKIAVCVKQVPEGTKRIDPDTKRLDRSGEGALNPFDTNAVEGALRLKETTGDGEGGVVSLGAAKGQDALRKGRGGGGGRA